MNPARYSVFSRGQPLFAGCLIFSILLGAALLPAVAQDIYVAQNGLGNATGVDASDAYPLTWFNTPSNWGAGAGQIGPGTTVHLCGTISSSLAVQGSGTSGNPITILFEPGAMLSSPCWAGATVAINITGQHDVVVNGGVNGVIQCTANGVNLANGVSATGLFFASSSYCTVENLTVQNMYVAVNGANNASYGIGISFIDSNGSGSSNNMVTNCVFHDEFSGVQINYGTNFYNFTIDSCTFYNCNWGGSAGSGGGNGLMNGLTVSRNHFYNWQSWNDPSDNNHHNGFYVFAEGSFPCATNLNFWGNTLGPGFGGNQTAGFFFSGDICNGNIYNNLINATDGGRPANAYIAIGAQWNVGSSAFRVWNNTFVGQPGNANGAIGVSMIGNQGHGAQMTFAVTNNLFYGIQTPIAVGWASSLNFASDYNLIYADPVPANMFGWATASTAGYVCSASIWQGATGNDKHSVQGNPLLDSHFAPQTGSAAIGAGVNLSSFSTTDLNGNPRPLLTNAWTIGAYELSVTGSLGVQISPPDAVATGAQWQVDGGAFQTNGTTLTNVVVGQHVVSFTPVPGCLTPSNQTVVVAENLVATVAATYTNVPQTGGLQVILAPTNVPGAGWQINGQTPLFSGGAVLTTVPAGSNFISFNSLTGWEGPPGQAVFITNGQLTTLKVGYTNLPSWGADLHVVQATTRSLIAGMSGGGTNNNLNGLVGWWTMDDLSGLDASGNGNTLTFSGVPTLIGGEITNAVLLNGSSQYGDAGIGSSLNPTNAITVMAWVNFKSFSPSYSAVVSKIVSGATAFYQIFVKSTGQLAVFVQSTSAGVNYDGSGSYTLSTGTWYHIAFTYSGDTGLIGYVNGQQDGTASGTAPLQSNSANTTIGIDLNTSGRLANALIDDVRIYNRALSASEIASQYQWPATVAAQ